MAQQLNRCLQETEVPDWMTKGITTLIQKDPQKGNIPSNYRPITCLPMMWKILTAVIKEEIYASLNWRNLFPEEQKGCRKGKRGTHDLLYIDQYILKEVKNKQKNIAMAWIDYRKAYDMVPHTWILECLKMYKISNNIINFIEKAMENWRVQLKAGKQSLAEVKIQRGIFQGDSLSPLLFIIAMMPLNHILKKCTGGYKFTNSQEKINHLMYMDDIKIFAKNEKELETLVQTIRIYSQDIGMEFGIEKCAMLVIKRGERKLMNGIQLPNQDTIKSLDENESYKYLGILEADNIKQAEMKGKVKKRISQEN